MPPSCGSDSTTEVLVSDERSEESHIMINAREQLHRTNDAEHRERELFISVRQRSSQRLSGDKAGTKGQTPLVGSGQVSVGGQKSAGGEQKSNVGGQKSGGRGQRSLDGGEINRDRWAHEKGQANSSEGTDRVLLVTSYRQSSAGAAYAAAWVGEGGSLQGHCGKRPRIFLNNLVNADIIRDLTLVCFLLDSFRNFFVHI